MLFYFGLTGVYYQLLMLGMILGLQIQLMLVRLVPLLGMLGLVKLIMVRIGLLRLLLPIIKLVQLVVQLLIQMILLGMLLLLVMLFLQLMKLVQLMPRELKINLYYSKLAFKEVSLLLAELNHYLLGSARPLTPDTLDLLLYDFILVHYWVEKRPIGLGVSFSELRIISVSYVTL